MELLEEEHPDQFTWTVVDISTREGLKQLQRLRPMAGRQIPIPAILVDGQILFDHVPDLEDLNDWLTANLAPADCDLPPSE